MAVLDVTQNNLLLTSLEVAFCFNRVVPECFYDVIAPWHALSSTEGFLRRGRKHKSIPIKCPETWESPASQQIEVVTSCR